LVQLSLFLHLTIKKKDSDEEVTPESSNKDHLVNHFREVKNLSNVYIYSSSGKVTFLFSDEKRILLGYLTNLNDKNIKFISKSLDQDVVCDLAFSESRSRIAVGLKNSKEIIFYDLTKDSSGKQCLTKLEDKKISTKHKFEIKMIAYTKCGGFIVSSGKDDDTSVEIYDALSLNHIQTINISEIKNVEMKFTPDEKYLTISTFMYEIGVIEFKKTSKFNKNMQVEEFQLKIQRNKSIGGIKVPIAAYEFSNENRYFAVSCENRKIKIFENSPPLYAVEESKIIAEIDIKEKGILYGEKVSLYITDVVQSGCKLNGLIAVSYDTNILVYNIDGKLLKYFKNAHDTRIVYLKLINESFNTTSKKCALISTSRDGKFQIWTL